MRFGKIIIGLLTVVFLAAALLLGAMEYERPQAVSLSALVSGPGGTEQLRSWQADSGELYMFLPGYASLDGTILHTEGPAEAWLEGMALGNGLSARDLTPGRSYGLSYEEKGQLRETTLTILCSGNLPTLYVDTRSGSLDYISAKRENQESGALRLYSPEGKQEQALTVQALENRGNATYGEPKAAFNLTLSEPADLLDMGAAEKWVLLANAYDGTNLKNKITYDFAREFGLAYTPQCRWVDLYLNGEYAGLYLLSERNEVHPQRVSLEEDSSFLVSKELESNLEKKSVPYVKLASDYAIRIHHSAFDNETVTGILQSVENAILASDGIDPVTGKHFTELIDLDSWARKFLVEEVFGNADAGLSSQFYYYEADDGKLYAGPLWDMDMTIGRILAQSFAHKPVAWPGEQTPWLSSLMQQDVFYDYTVALYRQEFLPLLEQLLEEKLDRYTDLLLPASAMNRVRWSTDDQKDAAEGIRRYLSQRRDFLWDLWVEETEYCWVSMYYPDGPHAHVYARKPGESYYDPHYFTGENVLGWYNADTGTYVDTDREVVSGDTVLQLQFAPEPEQSLGQWLRNCAGWLVPFGALLAMLMLLILRDRQLYKPERRVPHGRKCRDEIPS